MTLSAYINNVKKMKEHEVDWEALYINVPDMEELRSRLRYSPFSEEEV